MSGLPRQAASVAASLTAIAGEFSHSLESSGNAGCSLLGTFALALQSENWLGQ
jgi:hypothetical protein